MNTTDLSIRFDFTVPCISFTPGEKKIGNRDMTFTPYRQTHKTCCKKITWCSHCLKSSDDTNFHYLALDHKRQYCEIILSPQVSYLILQRASPVLSSPSVLRHFHWSWCADSSYTWPCVSFLHSSGFLGGDFSLVAAVSSAAPSFSGCIVAFVHVPGITREAREAKMSHRSKCYRIHLKLTLVISLGYYSTDHKSKE